MSQPIRGRARLAAAVPSGSPETRALAEHAAAIGRVERAVPLEHTLVGALDGRGAGQPPALVTGRNDALISRWSALGSYVVTMGSSGLWRMADARVIGSGGRWATVRAFDSDARTISVLVWSLVGAAADLVAGDRLIVTALELRSLE